MSTLHFPQNVVELELLLQVYYQPGVKADESISRSAAADRLLRNEMIRWLNDRGMFTVTTKGTVYIEHLLKTPYPVAHFVIPEAA
jgi:hypothetical protein